MGKKISYYVDYTAPPIGINTFVRYSTDDALIENFIAGKQRRDIIDSKNNIIGFSNYDLKINLDNATSTFVYADYTNTQTFTLKNTNFVVFIVGKVKYMSTTTNPSSFPEGITDAEIVNIATTNVFVNDKVYINVAINDKITKSRILKYTLDFEKAIKTN